MRKWTDFTIALITKLKILRPTPHKIGNFGDGSSQLLSWLSTEEIITNTMKANTKNKQKINTQCQSQVWSSSLTFGLEMEQALFLQLQTGNTGILL